VLSGAVPFSLKAQLRGRFGFSLDVDERHMYRELKDMYCYKLEK
jgi:hypothetical protein